MAAVAVYVVVKYEGDEGVEQYVSLDEREARDTKIELGDEAEDEGEEFEYVLQVRFMDDDGEEIE